MSRADIILLASVALLLFLLPAISSEFFISQIATRVLILGIIALSLAFLAQEIGIISLAQVMIAGIAGYAIALMSHNSAGLGVEMPLVVAVVGAILAAGLAGILMGIISQRSTGIYAIMITLATSVAFTLFARQNYQIFNGFDGLAGITAPTLGSIQLSETYHFYFLCVISSLAVLMFTLYLRKTPLGLAFQALRDDRQRLAALGFRPQRTVVVAFGLVGLIAGVGGILLTWFNTRIAPTSIGLDVTLDVLIIAIIGGIGHPIGAFIGALVFVLLETFASDLIDRDRFNTLIGAVFLIVILLSPGGLIGFGRRAVERIPLLQTIVVFITRTKRKE